MKGIRGKRSVMTIGICNLFTCLTMLYFSPMEVFLGNIGEFMLPFGYVWWIQLLVALGAALILTILMIALPSKAGRIAASVSMGIGLAAYVQAMFLNGAMVNLTGKKMKIDQSGIMVNLAIWVVILAAVVTGIILLEKRKKSEWVMRFVAIVLTVVQLTALISLTLSTDLSDSSSENFLSDDGEFELAEGNNVIVFILDTCDDEIVNETLQIYPEIYELLSGWTYYANATSVYSRTYPALTYLLTGEKCYFDLPYEEYVAKAFENSSFLPDLYQAGTDIRLFPMDQVMVANNVSGYVANSSGYRYNQLSNLNIPKLTENMLRIGLYKSLPYILKNDVDYKLEKVNLTSFNLKGGSHEYYDPDFYGELLWNGGLSKTNAYHKAFRFYHLWGEHYGQSFDTEFAENEDAPKTESLRADVTMLVEYMDQMKALGIYDDATIIVTADHGFCGDDENSLDRPFAACPVMWVKYPGSDNTQPLQINRAPVAQDDLFVTIGKALGTDASAYGSGKALSDFTEDEARERYHYYTARYSDEDGEIALREYSIIGDANDFSNWKPTGNWWDINYSFNIVSQHRFTEETGIQPMR